MLNLHSFADGSSTRLRRREDGHVLLTLLLIVSLMTIAATAILPTIAFEIKRDREEEMIHRGVQYSRAIRSYYKKFGRYPTSLENLDNTNNLRYLRKHYKDPLNKNRDFKLLHYGDPGVALGGSIGSAPLAGAATVASLASSGSSGSAFGSSSSSQSSSFGGSSGGVGGNSSFGGNSTGNSNGGFGGGFGGSGSFGSSNNTGTSNTTGTNEPAGADSSQSGAPASQDPNSAQGGQNGQNGGGQVFGGGPIVGVASVSKDSTIREFNHKHKYNEWIFVYDPTTDLGGLIRTPNQPQLQLGQALQPGANGQPGSTNGSAFGQSNGSSFGSSNGGSFGQSGGFGNNNTIGGPPPAQPPSTPQQQ